jgi:hypothetical protein
MVGNKTYSAVKKCRYSKRREFKTKRPKTKRLERDFGLVGV